MSDPFSPPPSKVFKPSAEATDVKEAFVAFEDNINCINAVEEVLGDGDLVGRILPFILHPATSPLTNAVAGTKITPEDWKVHFERQDGVRQNLLACLCVSKLWNQESWKLVCPAIPHVISSSELVHLKKRLALLDLSFFLGKFKDHSECQAHKFCLTDTDLEFFLAKGVDAGKERSEDTGTLKIFEDYPHWIRELPRYYKHFLLVKSVEALAARLPLSDSCGDCNVVGCGCDKESMWKKRGSHPCEVIAAYWKTHQQSPCSYAQACKVLIGEETMGGQEKRARPQEEGPCLDYDFKLSNVLWFEKQMVRGDTPTGTITKDWVGI